MISITGEFQYIPEPLLSACTHSGPIPAYSDSSRVVLLFDALLRQPSPGILSHIGNMLQHIPGSASCHASYTRCRMLHRHRRRSCILLWHTYCSWTSLEQQIRKYPHIAGPSECILSSSPHHVHPNMRCNNGYRLPYSASIPRYIVELVHVTSSILLSVLALIGLPFFKVVCN